MINCHIARFIWRKLIEISKAIELGNGERLPVIDCRQVTTAAATLHGVNNILLQYNGFTSRETRQHLSEM